MADMEQSRSPHCHQTRTTRSYETRTLVRKDRWCKGEEIHPHLVEGLDDLARGFLDALVGDAQRDCEHLSPVKHLVPTVAE